MKKNISYLLLNLLLLYSAGAALAQTPLTDSTSARNGLGISVTGYYGKIVPHNQKFNRDILNGPTRGVELTLFRQLGGTRFWHQLHKYPEPGLSLLYLDLSQSDKAGSAVALLPHFSWHIINTEPFDALFRVGLGVAYLNKPYHVITNPENNVIGSRLNNTTQFSLQLVWMPVAKFGITAAGAFTHFSNGRFQSPNLGFNALTANLGLRYLISEPVYYYHDTLPPLKRRLRLNLQAGFAMSEFGPPGGPKYPTYIASIFGSYRVSHISKVLLGHNNEFRYTTYDFLKQGEIFVGDEKKNSFNGSVFIGHELMIGSIGLPWIFGYYYHNNYLMMSAIYTRLGLQYHFPPLFKDVRLQTGIYLKSHYAVADFIEVGAGISF